MPTSPSLVSVPPKGASRKRCASATAGALFLSEDAGKHWVSIVRQWDGRTVEVRVKPAHASPSAAVFEIVNDRGLTWASADGKTWKAN
jgi:photosystem II stability/assembly factor-like uncharacterized protein